MTILCILNHFSPLHVVSRISGTFFLLLLYFFFSFRLLYYIVRYFRLLFRCNNNYFSHFSLCTLAQLDCYIARKLYEISRMVFSSQFRAQQGQSQFSRRIIIFLFVRKTIILPLRCGEWISAFNTHCLPCIIITPGGHIIPKYFPFAKNALH